MIGNIAAGLFGVGVPPVTNSYESIATVSVGSGGQSSVSFTSIPSTYKHLQLRAFSRTTAGSAQDLHFQFNSDTAANYSMHYLLGNGSGAFAGATSGTSFIRANGALAGATNTFGTTVIDILDYGSTSKYKTTRHFNGWDANGSGQSVLDSGNWRSTSAITSILFYPSSGNFAQYTSLALYGIKD